MTKIEKFVSNAELESHEADRYLGRRQNWRHVARLAGELSAPSVLIEKVLTIDPLLAGRCLAETVRNGRSLETGLRERVVAALVAACDQEPQCVGRALCDMTVSRLAKLIRVVLYDEPVLLRSTLEEYLEIYFTSTTESLLKDLDSRDPKVRTRAALGLSVFGDTRNNRMVIRLLEVYDQDPDDWVRMRAEWALDMMYDQRISTTFMRLVEAKSGTSIARRILATAARVRDVRVLLRGIRSATVGEREIALWGLGRLRNSRRAREAVRQACRDPVREIRAKAREVLKQWKLPRP